MAGLWLAGCAALPPDLYGTATVPMALAGTGDLGVRDLRASYRQAVCRRLPSGDDGCTQWLLQLSGEGAAPGTSASPPPAPADLAQRYRIAFVPGFMAECFEQVVRPFADVERDLRSHGFTVDYFQVSGRGSTAANAQRRARHFESRGADPRPIILFAYSKGLPDTLDFVATYPGAATRIAAVVAVAGAVNGSPLADDLLAPYRQWLVDFPLPGCDVGNGDELHDLRRDVRLGWWREHGAQVKVPVFTLVAAPRPPQVSPGTRGTYRWLARIDPRNDGKLLWTDQVVPGSHLLGYANADHWTIAVPVLEALPSLALMFRDGVPRSALVEGAIEVVADTLSGAAAR